MIFPVRCCISHRHGGPSRNTVLSRSEMWPHAHNVTQEANTCGQAERSRIKLVWLPLCRQVPSQLECQILSCIRLNPANASSLANIYDMTCRYGYRRLIGTWTPATRDSFPVTRHHRPGPGSRYKSALHRLRRAYLGSILPSLLLLTCDEQSIIPPSLVAVRAREQSYNKIGRAHV